MSRRQGGSQNQVGFIIVKTAIVNVVATAVLNQEIVRAHFKCPLGYCYLFGNVDGNNDQETGWLASEQAACESVPHFM